jgi:thiamine-monophosphate kinase
LADRHGIDLVGGDTTAGPLNICITVFGEMPAGAALLRSGARAGDDLWVSGILGDARAALECFRGNIDPPGATFAALRRAMELPEPRVALGRRLRGLASSAIDVSDGLLGDLQHILDASDVAAQVELDALPRSAALATLPDDLQRSCLLQGGDDYELLFSAAPQRAAEVLAAGRDAGVPVTRIGRIVAGAGLAVVDAAGQPLPVEARGFDHFRE